MKKCILGIFIASIFLSSCSYLNEEELYPFESCDTSNITFTKDIKPILEQNCYICHSNSVEYYGNLSFEDSTHIQRVVDNGKLLKNIKHEPDGTPMPQGAGKLSDCKINKIENWINQGNPYK